MSTTKRGQRAKAPSWDRGTCWYYRTHPSQREFLLTTADRNGQAQIQRSQTNLYPSKSTKQGHTRTWGVRETQKTAGCKSSCRSPVPGHLQNLTSNCFLIFLRSRLWKVLYKGFNPQIGTDSSYSTWDPHSLKGSGRHPPPTPLSRNTEVLQHNLSDPLVICRLFMTLEEESSHIKNYSVPFPYLQAFLLINRAYMILYMELRQLIIHSTVIFQEQFRVSKFRFCKVVVLQSYSRDTKTHYFLNTTCSAESAAS